MKSFFSLLTQLSLRFRPVTLALVLVFSVLGIVAITQLKQELLPSVEFPQTIILSQVSGLSSDQVLNIITKPIEKALGNVKPIVNLESTTTGAFGSVIIARNNFGANQEKIRAEIQTALDSVWLPLRRIQPPEGQNPHDFAAKLLADIQPDVLIYLHEKDPNFLFQLSPEVWASFSDDTVRQTLAYLAGQVEKTQANKSALQNLIEKDVLPQLENLEVVASVAISGGQILPGDKAVSAPAANASAAPSSLLLKLSPEVWKVVSAKAGNLGALNDDAVKTLSATKVEVPTDVPALPTSWQMDHFTDASDLWEMNTLTRSVGKLFNSFHDDGRIVGALGQTDDLTPEVVTKMLALDPGMTTFFKSEHLAAMSPEVFAALPSDYVANLDGLTRDALAAGALAESVTGKKVPPKPVNLPSAWRIQPPQQISFSFDDLPLASFSVFSATKSEGQTGTGDASAVEATPAPEVTATPQASTTTTDLPEGPALPKGFSSLGILFVGQMDTADGLFKAKLAPAAAQLGGGNTALDPAGVLNGIVQIDGLDASKLPAVAQLFLVPIQSSLDANQLIGEISPEAIRYIIQHDPKFLSKLTPDIYNAFSNDVLKLPQVAPPLADAWNTMAARPQFAAQPLHTAADVIALGGGKASKVLNTIDETVPKNFAGYEVRLFDSLSTGTLRYFAQQEPDFYKNLDKDVLTKLSPAALKQLPPDFFRTLDEGTGKIVSGIAEGKVDSAAKTLAARYTTNLPPSDPAAPVINSEWGFVGNFFGVQLAKADDFFRFPDNFAYKTPSAFMNSMFDSAQGASFAVNLFGKLPPSAVEYMLKRDPKVFNDLRPEALQLMPADVVKVLPQDLQDRAKSGGKPFTPTAAVTRTNGDNSYLITVYKNRSANTVEAFHKVADKFKEIQAKDPSISVTTAFEQASFIEESISGVAREGGLGGVFAIVVILAFLSAGVWARSPRQRVGAIMVVLFLALLVMVVIPSLNAAGGDAGQAFAGENILVPALLVIGAVAGLLIIIWPGNLPYPAWRSTLVVAVSIPLSLLIALAVMRWLPPFVHNLLAPAAENSSLLAFVIRLFPPSITINIMTLSGLTVAIGRVVDDSIVVLENIFRQIQQEGSKPGADKKAIKRQAIIAGTRDVSVAIFAATVITVIVFLPLGMTGGIISEFFLPFGLAVTYSLLASFIVAITVVPVMAYLFVSTEDVTEEHQSVMERAYLPVLRWALASGRNQAIVLVVALLSLIIGGALFAGRPTTFLPGFGEPQIGIAVNLPPTTKIVETNAKVTELEKAIQADLKNDLSKIQTIVGSGGASIQSLLLGGSSVSENIANITIGIKDQSKLDSWAQQIRAKAESIFGKANVKVSAASLSEQGFGGFALVLSGPQEALIANNQKVIDTLNAVPGLANVVSNLAQVGASADGPITYIRIDGESAVRYTGELETQNTLGVTSKAIETIKKLPDLPADIKVSQGFESQLQTEGFQSLFVAMAIAIVIVIVILMVTFGSVVHWFDIILSIVVAPVGAAVALTLTDRVLGISAMIGLLMLIGIVVTNAVVLIDRVQSNRRERGMGVKDALLEAGDRRLRPILMTALATIMALMPLAIGLSKGAIIASELGTVVIGGLVSSTLLTLIVVPVMYSLLTPVHKRVMAVFGRKDH